jgi:hypothetical protein
MKKLFLMQSVAIFLLLFLQMSFQEGNYDVLYKTASSFAILLASSIAVGAIVTGVRKLFSRGLNFQESTFRTSIYVFAIYYVIQLLGWLKKEGMMGGGV